MTTRLEASTAALEREKASLTAELADLSVQCDTANDRLYRVLSSRMNRIEAALIDTDRRIRKNKRLQEPVGA